MPRRHAGRPRAFFQANQPGCDWQRLAEHLPAIGKLEVIDAAISVNGDRRYPRSLIIASGRRRRANHSSSRSSLTKSDYFVLKPMDSGFYQAPLEILLRYLEASTLVLAGLTTNSSIVCTAHDAKMREFDLYVPSDCSAARTIKGHRQAVEHIRIMADAIMLKAGDMLVLPAATAIDAWAVTMVLKVIGAYPRGQSHYDLKRQGGIIPRASLPLADPFYGPDGPLLKAWQAIDPT